MLCYKYMSCELLQRTLKEDAVYIKASSPVEFNDPFDCVGRLDLSKGFSKEFLIDAAQFFGVESGKDLETFVTVRFGVSLSDRRFFDDWVRIASFCDAKLADPTSEKLMWSHYGNKLSGARLTLDFTECERKPEPVRYSVSLPALRCWEVTRFSPKDRALFRFMEDCLLTKSLAWSYEREMRAIIPICELERHEEKYFWRLPKKSVKAICFGGELGRDRLQFEKMQGFVRGLQRSGYNHVQYDYCLKDDESYGYKLAPFAFPLNGE